MLSERIGAFVRGESAESFEELALELFRAQHRRHGRLGRRRERLRLAPEAVSDWRQVPAWHAAETTAPEPGDTQPGDTAAVDPAESAARDALRRAVIDRCLAGTGLRSLGSPPVLSLIASGNQAAEPGLGFLAGHLLATRAAPDSLVAVARRGVEVARARSFLGARQRDRRPTLVLATPATLDALLAGLARRGLRFRLPPGSRVVEAGVRGPAEPALPARLEKGLGVPPDGLVRVYGVAGLPTRFWAGHGPRGEPRPFRPPPWTRVRILDPDTLDEAPAGSPGAISIFDLASVAGPAHRLTGDTGFADGEGFRLVADP